MTSLNDQIARDLQQKLNDDIAHALLRAHDLAPSGYHLALALQAVCTTLDFSSQLLESELGFSTGARHLSVYLVALMAARAYAAKEPVFNATLAQRARDDMTRLGLFTAGAGHDVRDNAQIRRYAVSIDNGPVVGRVIGFSFYPHGHQVQVSWWNNGALVEQWVGDFRLTPVEDIRK